MIVRTVVLSLRLLRLGGRRAVTSAALIGIGIVMGTAMLAVALVAVHGWDAREARVGWRAEGVGSPAGEPVALLRTNVDAAAGRVVHRVDVAAVQPGAPAPPGLPRTPAPGEVWLSPALAALARELPPDALADRFPAPAGLIAEAGLMGPDELVAVVGRAPAEMPDAKPVAAFDATDPNLMFYRQLTYVAAALLVFPVASLLGASARLTAARRAERLATLRLLGASTGQVTVVAVAEVTAIAVVAAALGVALQWAAAPALAAIELGGSAWFAADLRPGPAMVSGIVGGVAVLAMLSALGGMREVVVGPLGVARRQRAGAARLLRLLGLAGGVAVFAAANGARQVASANIAGLVFGVGVLALFGAVSLIGPLVVRLLGSGMARSARAPAALLAGRRLLDDPRGAFRPLAGVTMAVFVAGFLAPLTAAVPATAFGDDTALRIEAPAGAVAGLEAAVRDRLAERRIAADVVLADVRGEVGLAVTPTLTDDRDRVRTALAPLAAGPVLTMRESEADGVQLVTDLQRGALVVLIGTFLIAATATGTAAAARVLDHRRTLRLLRLAGTPLGVLDAARRAETVRPLLVLGAIALAMGLLCASPFAAATSVVEPAALALLAVALAVGIGLMVAASAASRPLLRAVTTSVGRED